MNETEDRSRPPATLSPRQLTLALVVVTLLPFTLVVLMWYSMPKDKEPVLNAVVNVGPAAWPINSVASSRTVPCVVLRNPTVDDWENVSLSINKQFFFYHPDPIAGGQQIAIPLQHFRTKGNQNYEPDIHVIKKITVFAQIPSGARAIHEIDYDGQPIDTAEVVGP